MFSVYLDQAHAHMTPLHRECFWCVLQDRAWLVVTEQLVVKEHLVVTTNQTSTVSQLNRALRPHSYGEKQRGLAWLTEDECDNSQWRHAP